MPKTAILLQEVANVAERNLRVHNERTQNDGIANRLERSWKIRDENKGAKIRRELSMVIFYDGFF